jgi:hypothetical protein
VPPWVATKPTLAIVLLDITVVELGRFTPKRTRKAYGVQSPDRYGIMTSMFELGKRADRDAFLLGLSCGFSWRELHRDPERRVGWRFQNDFERKADEGDYTNKGKWCYQFGPSGWTEIEDYDDLGEEPDIGASLGTFATVTDEPFQYPSAIGFLARGKAPFEVQLAPENPFAKLDLRPYRALAKLLASRLQVPVPSRTAMERRRIKEAHGLPIELEFPNGFPRRTR